MSLSNRNEKRKKNKTFALKKRIYYVRRFPTLFYLPSYRSWKLKLATRFIANDSPRGSLFSRHRAGIKNSTLTLQYKYWHYFAFSTFVIPRGRIQLDPYCLSCDCSHPLFPISLVGNQGCLTDISIMPSPKSPLAAHQLASLALLLILLLLLVLFLHRERSKNDDGAPSC